MEGCEHGVLADLFRRIARHLLTQNAKARNDKGGCRYWQPDTGRKCAVGCLIRPDFYVETIEGREADSDEVLQVLERSGVSVAHRAVRDLLLMLQRVHDHEAVEDWAHVLTHMAKENGFEMPCQKN